MRAAARTGERVRDTPLRWPEPNGVRCPDGPHRIQPAAARQGEGHRDAKRPSFSGRVEIAGAPRWALRLYVLLVCDLTQSLCSPRLDFEFCKARPAPHCVLTAANEFRSHGSLVACCPIGTQGCSRKRLGLAEGRSARMHVCCRRGGPRWTTYWRSSESATTGARLSPTATCGRCAERFSVARSTEPLGPRRRRSHLAPLRWDYRLRSGEWRGMWRTRRAHLGTA